jgi:hypothetical protein
MATHEFHGLDATNPLGFLAALGLLTVLDHRHRKPQARPTLYFAEGASSFAIVGTPLSVEEVIDTILSDAAEKKTCAALRLAYDKEGSPVDCAAPEAIRDLKPTPSHAREFLQSVALGDHRTAGIAAGFFSELAQDNNSRTKPSALHFTAGQQTFLSMAEELRSGITAADCHEALAGPWRSTSTLPSFSWDSAATRLYALRSVNPSLEKRGSVPAANWLGLQAMHFFPVAVRRQRLSTTCVVGGWKDSVFSWPTWRAPLTSSVVASLLRSDFKALTAQGRAAVGLSQVFTSRIVRSDPGGYGSFTPAEVVLPSQDGR